MLNPLITTIEPSNQDSRCPTNGSEKKTRMQHAPRQQSRIADYLHAAQVEYDATRKEHLGDCVQDLVSESSKLADGAPPPQGSAQISVADQPWTNLQITEALPRLNLQEN